MAETAWEEVQRELRAIRKSIETLTREAEARSALTYEEAGRLLSCSKSHIARMVARGAIATTMIGKLKRIPRSEIERLTTPTPRERPAASVKAPRRRQAPGSGRFDLQAELAKRRAFDAGLKKR